MQTAVAESILDMYKTSGVPELLKELEITRDLQILYKSWNEIFSQGSVFSYSFLAFPELVRIAEQWHYSERVYIIYSAAFIFREEEIDSVEKNQQSPVRVFYQQEINTLIRLIEEDLQQPNLSDRHFGSLLCAMLPFKGYPLLTKDFEYFVSSLCGWCGWCDICETETEIYVYENSVIAELETSNGQKLRTSIEPISPECLIGISKWLYETAKQREMDSIANKVLCMLGTVKCINCGTQFQMPEYFAITESFCKL